MKSSLTAALITFTVMSLQLSAQTGSVSSTTSDKSKKNLYIDVHHLTPGKITYKDIEGAHAKDLQVEKKYGVHILRYWANADKGLVYCLASAGDSNALRQTHAEAHGLIPDQIYKVTEGNWADVMGKKNLFLDMHELGAGKVTAKDVEAAHVKDLATEHKYGVNIINYWFDEKSGIVMCLAEAKDANALIKTHKEAHGLVPISVVKVKQGK
ncbi:MAG: DUF4242 domain-containing protein [Bacteroidetes bacterium]|nr:DUF4242 domain-containing protein [Bacteroidota bacterium]